MSANLTGSMGGGVADSDPTGILPIDMSDTSSFTNRPSDGTAAKGMVTAMAKNTPSPDPSTCDCAVLGEIPAYDSVKDCLELMLSLEFFQRYKAKSFKLLEVGSGSRVLEVGCGTGADAKQLAKMVGKTGSVVAVDKSEAMIAELNQQPQLPKSLTTKVADVCALPFADGSFHAARVDRTLQHVPDVVTAIDEIVRVVASGGRVVAIEPDWATLLVDSDDVETTRTVSEVFCDGIRHGWIGRNLFRHFLAAGLTDVQVFPNTSILTDLDTANEILHLEKSLSRCVEKGYLEKSTTRRWFEDLKAKDARGQFFSSLTLFLVRGRKPLHQSKAPSGFLKNLMG